MRAPKTGRRAARSWKYVGPNPSNWKEVGKGGLGDTKNAEVMSAAVFGTPRYLYFMTSNTISGCQVLRTNGAKWEKANTGGFGKGKFNSFGPSLVVFDGTLCAGVGSWFGARIYATSGGSKLPFAWTQLNDDGYSENDNEGAMSATFYGGRLYVGTLNGLGCQVWRYDGNGWTQVASGGFGDINNSMRNPWSPPAAISTSGPPTGSPEPKSGATTDPSGLRRIKTGSGTRHRQKRQR